MAVSNSATDVDLSYNQAHMEKAFYAAEAGAKQGFLDINEDNAWRTGYTSVSILVRAPFRWSPSIQLVSRRWPTP